VRLPYCDCGMESSRTRKKSSNSGMEKKMESADNTSDVNSDDCSNGGFGWQQEGSSAVVLGGGDVPA